MVSDRVKRFWQAGENATAVVADLRQLPVLDLPGAADLASERLADALVAKAHAKQRNAAGEVAHKFNADTGISRPTRARRNHDLVGRHRLHLTDRNGVVAHHFHLSTKLAEVLVQVVSKAVVVIHEHKHVSLLQPPADALIEPVRRPTAPGSAAPSRRA